MDRAHRLGQQRVVNVYRLLVRGTLEEQILSLQRFKLDVAATLVNQDNVSLAAMDTSHLLDLFAAQVGRARAEVVLLSVVVGVAWRSVAARKALGWSKRTGAAVGVFA